MLKNLVKKVDETPTTNFQDAGNEAEAILAWVQNLEYEASLEQKAQDAKNQEIYESAE